MDDVTVVGGQVKQDAALRRAHIPRHFWTSDPCSSVLYTDHGTSTDLYITGASRLKFLPHDVRFQLLPAD